MSDKEVFWKNRNTPQGKDCSPLAWQILENRNHISITLVQSPIKNPLQRSAES